MESYIERIERLEKEVATLQSIVYNSGSSNAPIHSTRRSLPPFPYDTIRRRYAYNSIREYLVLPRDDVIDWVEEFINSASGAEWQDDIDDIMECKPALYDILLEFSKNPHHETIRVFEYNIWEIKNIVKHRMYQRDYRQLWDNLSANPSSYANKFFEKYPEDVNWDIVSTHNIHPREPSFITQFTSEQCMLPPVPNHIYDQSKAYSKIKRFLLLSRTDVFDWVDNYFTLVSDDEWENNTYARSGIISSLYPILLMFSKNPHPETICIIDRNITNIITHVKWNMNRFLYRQLWDNLSANPSPAAIDFFEKYPEDVNWNIVSTSNSDPRVPGLVERYRNKPNDSP